MPGLCYVYARPLRDADCCLDDASALVLQPRPLDPQLGRECFEQQRVSLPPGTQYEGFEASGDRITIKVMTGAELTSVDCMLSPDGTLATQAVSEE